MGLWKTFENVEKMKAIDDGEWLMMLCTLETLRFQRVKNFKKTWWVATNFCWFIVSILYISKYQTCFAMIWSEARTADVIRKYMLQQDDFYNKNIEPALAFTKNTFKLWGNRIPSPSAFVCLIRQKKFPN